MKPLLRMHGKKLQITRYIIIKIHRTPRDAPIWESPQPKWILFYLKKYRGENAKSWQEQLL